MAFPYDRGQMSVDNYLLRLLSALVIEAGGELRVKAKTMLNLEAGSAITRTRDHKRDEIVLRFGSTNTETYFVGDPAPESPKRQEPQWQGPTQAEVNLKAAQHWAASDNPQRHSRHVVLDDMQQFLQEQHQQNLRDAVLREEESRRQFRTGDMPYRNYPEGRPPK